MPQRAHQETLPTPASMLAAPSAIYEIDASSAAATPASLRQQGQKQTLRVRRRILASLVRTLLCGHFPVNVRLSASRQAGSSHSEREEAFGFACLWVLSFRTICGREAAFHRRPAT